ncbi:MAG: insulinase family protein [Flavobacteriaceae bacterium]|nr:insulinase family protein [Flavobacteriaceae bacterium]
MKTKILSLIALVFMGITTMHGQIDRSKQPTPGPAPKINIGKPQSFILSNGLKVMVVENHKLPRVSLNLRLDNPPVLDGDKAGVSELTGAMLGKGSKTITKDAFNEEVDYMGANLDLGAHGGFASGLSKYFNRLVTLMADAAINPNFTQVEFDKEKEKALEGIKSEEKNVKAVANRVKDFLVYGKNHPYGEYISKETVNNVTLADVSKFYQNYFVPDNAYLVIIGDVKYKDVKEVVTEHFSNWRKGLAPSISIPVVKNVQFTQVNFIDMPDAVQSEIAVVNTVDLKMNDADYHAVLIANKIYGGSFNSMLNLNLREAHGWTYGARSSLRADKDTQATFTSSTSVRNAVTDSAVVETLKELKNIRTIDVTLKQLNNVKAKYLGDFVLAMEKPQTISRYALNIETNKLPANYYETFLKKINAVTIADVKRVANKYFLADNSRIVIAGKGSDVVEGLEKMMHNGKKIPVKYFDKYGNPTEKPVFSKPLPKGITAQSVIDTYFKAIGGKDVLSKVKTIVFSGDMNAMGQVMGIQMKKMTPNKSAMEVTHPQAGVVMKQVFDGEAGYTAQMGQKKPMSEEDVVESKNKNVLFEELSFDMSKVTLESMTSINGEDAYKLKVTGSGEPEYRYYNAKSGYLVKSESTKKAQGQTISISTEYGNYTPTKGIQFPFSLTTKQGPQTFGMIIKEVKVNEGVTDADFK